MSLDNRGSRLTRRDVTDLAAASEQLAVVANQISSSGVKWAAAAIQLLIAANNVVMRIHTKGSAAFARYLEKHPSQTPQDAPAGAELVSVQDQAPKSEPGEQED
jgi:hypothetical protein